MSAAPATTSATRTVAPQVAHGNRVRAALLPGRPPHAADWAGPWPASDDPARAETEVRAICCSGGGIRAAAFALGGLQHLTTRPDGDGSVYSKTDLVTSVSGGGYTAGSFALIQHHLAGDAPAVYAPGTFEDNRLRAHTRYLADSKTQLTMSLMGIVYSLALNLVAIVAAMMIVASAVGIALGRNALNALRVDAGGRSFTTHIPHGLVLAIVAMSLAGLAVYSAYRLCDMYSPLSSAAAKRWSVVSMLLLGAAGVAALLLLGVPTLLATLDHAPSSAAASSGGVKTGTVVGTVTALAGIVAQLIRTYVPAKGSGSSNPAVTTVLTKGQPVLARIANRMLPWLGSLLIMAAMAVVLLTWVSVTVRSGGDEGWAVICGSALLLAVWKLVTDCNRTSLHRPYTQRLAAAFGVTRDGADCDNEADRLSRYTSAEHDRPQLVICAAVNTDQPGGTPSGRNCAPFTFSAHTAGISSGTMFNPPAAGAGRGSSAFDLGGRETGGPDRRQWNADYRVAVGRKRAGGGHGGLWMDTTTFEGHANGPTIMDLVAVSGAAVAPAMGRLSRPSLRLLLGVANVRLGMWLPNPLYGRRIKSPGAVDGGGARRAGRGVWRRLSQPGLLSLFREIVGGLTLKRRWVYVTDGGHYENLGLVEALRRGATDVIVFDASGDTPLSLATFGEAVETARADLGIEITLDSDALTRSVEPALAGALAVRARAVYANGVVANIYLCKAAMVAGLPHDIVSWQAEHGDFPNTSTLDQFYGDREFEAYRKLGWLAAEEACELRENSRAARPAPRSTFGPTPLEGDLPTVAPRRRRLSALRRRTGG